MIPEAFKCGIMVVILGCTIILYIINILRVKFGRRCHFTASVLDAWAGDGKPYAAKPKRSRGLVPEIHEPSMWKGIGSSPRWVSDRLNEKAMEISKGSVEDQ